MVHVTVNYRLNLPERLVEMFLHFICSIQYTIVAFTMEYLKIISSETNWQLHKIIWLWEICQKKQIPHFSLLRTSIFFILIIFTLIWIHLAKYCIINPILVTNNTCYCLCPSGFFYTLVCLIGFLLIVSHCRILL